MKRLIFIVLLNLFYFQNCSAQVINFPSDFRLIKADGKTSQLDHYVKGALTFMRDDWTGTPPSNPKTFDPAVATFLAENYRTSLGKHVRFNGGLYYGNAYFSGKYWFEVLDYDVVYKLSSRVKDAAFQSCSSWLLNQIKRNGKIANMK